MQRLVSDLVHHVALGLLYPLSQPRPRSKRSTCVLSSIGILYPHCPAHVSPSMARGGMEMLCSMPVPKRGETTEKAVVSAQWAYTVISVASICAGQPESTLPSLSST